ncbi:hypothetical protein DL96DRAFT_1706959 [Flagelloscypha sp. PMI_526]|nr:hypothetical protein DL96DRAFT_1706959 [Flagelloscypha sp. PMI_526]
MAPTLQTRGVFGPGLLALAANVGGDFHFSKGAIIGFCFALAIIIGIAIYSYLQHRRLQNYRRLDMTEVERY